MESEKILMLLNVIYNGYNVSEFLENYLGYEELLAVIKVAKNEELILFINNRYELTEKGKEKREIITNMIGKKGVDKRIITLDKYRINKISINDVYLPLKF